MNQTQRNFIIDRLENEKYNLLKTSTFFYTDGGRKFLAKEIASGKHKLNKDAFFKKAHPYASDLFPTLYLVLNNKSYEHYKQEEARVQALRPKLEAKLQELKTSIMLGPVASEDLAAMVKELREVVK